MKKDMRRLLIWLVLFPLVVSVNRCVGVHRAIDDAGKSALLWYYSR